MKPENRRVVAYLAGRIIQSRDAMAIHDRDVDAYFQISGHVGKQDLQVQDGEGRDISGDRQGDEWQLFFHDSESYVTLNVNGDEFDGYDGESGVPFAGQAKDIIAIYDSETEEYHHYSF